MSNVQTVLSSFWSKIFVCRLTLSFGVKRIGVSLILAESSHVESLIALGVTVAFEFISLIKVVMRGVFRYFLMGLLDTSVAAFNKIILDVARSSTKYISNVLNIKAKRKNNKKKSSAVQRPKKYLKKYEKLVRKKTI